MAYIGKQPVVGNFQVCDAISVVNGQAAYTMQVGSTNVEPENANHMLVSLNGVLQKPGSSFTISGATITFASNLATGDVIDFIILLGDTLNVGTPSDDSVGAAQIKNDLISGTTALASEPDDTDEFLVSDAGTLKRIDYSLIKGGGITVADQWRLTSAFSITSQTTTAITSNLERVDTTGQGYIADSTMSESSGIFTFPSTGIYLVTFNASFSLNNNCRWIEFAIQATTDNSTYADMTSQNTFIQQTDSGETYNTGYTNTLIDVTDTSNVKVRFGVARHSNSVSLNASSSSNASYFTFIRLGDT